MKRSTFRKLLKARPRQKKISILPQIKKSKTFTKPSKSYLEAHDAFFN